MRQAVTESFRIDYGIALGRWISRSNQSFDINVHTEINRPKLFDYLEAEHDDGLSTYGGYLLLEMSQLCCWDALQS